MIRKSQFLGFALSLVLLACGSAATASPSGQSDISVSEASPERAKPVPEAPAQKTKNRTRSDPLAQPQKKRRFRRCKLGDFDCYESASPTLV